MSNSASPKLATFRLYRDHDVTGISGEGVVAEGVQFSDGWVVTHWVDRPPMNEPKTDVWHHKGTGPVTKIHGHGGSTRIVWTDDVAAARSKALADVAEAYDVPTQLLGPEAERAYLHRQISHALLKAWEARGTVVEHPEDHCAKFADAVMPTVEQVLTDRDHAQDTVGRAFALAGRWSTAHGSAMFLVRAAGAELRDELDDVAECPASLEPSVGGIVRGGHCVVRGPHDEHVTSNGTKFSEIGSGHQPSPPAIPWTGPEPAWADDLRAALATERAARLGANDRQACPYCTGAPQFLRSELGAHVQSKHARVLAALASGGSLDEQLADPETRCRLPHEMEV